MLFLSFDDHCPIVNRIGLKGSPESQTGIYERGPPALYPVTMSIKVLCCVDHLAPFVGKISGVEHLRICIDTGSLQIGIDLVCRTSKMTVIEMMVRVIGIANVFKIVLIIDISHDERPDERQ